MFIKVITITTIAVTVAVFVLAAKIPDAKEESGGIAIPLTKRSDTDARKFHATSHNAKIIRGPSGMDGSEMNNGTPHSSAVQRDESGAGLDLTKFMNGIWYGTIWIGTPPKPFTVQLNTGSSDLFVPALNGDINSKTHFNLWDPASSTTKFDLKRTFWARFIDGRYVGGKQYMDNVTIAGFTAERQVIGAATAYSSDMDATQFAPDGVLGLAFPLLSEFYGQMPLFHTLYLEGKLSQPVFSLKLAESGGELYVGGTNRALYLPSTLVYTPVIHPAVFWQLMIDDIQVNGEIVEKNVPAVIDTGANFIYGDPRRVWSVHQAAGGGIYQKYRTPSNLDGYHTFPCSNFPSVTFTIGGRPFLIPAKILNKGRVMKKSPNCFSAIAVAHTEHTFWTFGTVFLEQFYTVFDFNDQSPRVGFAELAR